MLGEVAISDSVTDTEPVMNMVVGGTVLLVYLLPLDEGDKAEVLAGCAN